MAERRAARRVAPLRTLDGEPVPEPPQEPRPTPEGVGATALPTRPTLDLEASRRRLEERQVTWMRFREEWIRRRREGRAAGMQPVVPEGSAEQP